MPPLPAADVDGREVIIGGSADAMSVLLFATPGCRLCRDVLPSLPALARGHRVRAFLITDGTNAETTRAYGSVRGDASLIASIDLAQTYSVPGTPYVVVLDEAGRVVGKGTVNNLEQFEGLVETAEHRIASDSVPEHV